MGNQYIEKKLAIDKQVSLSKTEKLRKDSEENMNLNLLFLKNIPYA